MQVHQLVPNVSLAKIYNYSNSGNADRLLLWRDYLNMANRLGYNLSDTSVSMPKNLNAAHDRVSNICKYHISEKLNKHLVTLNSERAKLIFADENYTIVLPQSMQDIVNEGKALSHCVGGYAERHAKGILTILFIRKNDDLSTPFYTMEITSDYHIVQCRGYKNNLFGNPKPDEIIAFEEKYAAFLQQLKNAEKKTA